MIIYGTLKSASTFSRGVQIMNTKAEQNAHFTEYGRVLLIRLEVLSGAVAVLPSFALELLLLVGMRLRDGATRVSSMRKRRSSVLVIALVVLGVVTLDGVLEIGVGHLIESLCLDRRLGRGPALLDRRVAAVCGFCLPLGRARPEADMSVASDGGDGGLLLGFEILQYGF